MNNWPLFFIIFCSSILLSFWSCQRAVEKSEIVDKWENGQTKTLAEYYSEQDSTLKVTEFYYSGALRSIFFYEKGMLSNEARGYFEDSTLAMVAHFKNGVRHGKEVTYYENGQVRSSFVYRNGMQVSGNNFYENGQPTGKLKFEDGLIVSGEYYHMDGSLRSKGAFSHGLRQGIWYYYHQNGCLKEVGEFRDGKRIGIWQEFDEQGNLIQELHRGRRLDN